MSVYRFTLGQFTLLEDQPHGWDAMEINIKRDSYFNSMYLMYTSDLVFWGEGWNFCKNVIDTVGICGKIDVLIEVDRLHNGQFKTLFDGIADFTEAKIDYERCEITVNVKDNIVMSMINDRSGNELFYANNIWEASQKGQTVNGEEIQVEINNDGTPDVVNSVARQIDIHDVITGAPDPTSYFPRVAYKVIDALKYHIAAITNNTVEVVSDFFSATNYQQELWDIQFDPFQPNLPGPGDQFIIKFVNGYNYAQTVTVPYVTSIPVTLQNIADKLIERADLDSGGDNRYNTQWLFGNDLFSYSEIDTSIGPNHIYLESFVPITQFSIECTNPLVAISGAKIRDITYGMGNLFVGFNTEISGKYYDGLKTISYDKLMKMLDARFDIGMGLQAVGGGNYTLRIEPKSWFFDNPEILDVGGVMNIKSEPNKDMTIKNIIVGDGGSDYFFNVVGRKQTWFVDQCEIGTTDKSTDGNFGIVSIGEQIGTFFQNYFQYNQNGVSFILINPGEENYGVAGNLVNPSCTAAQYRIRIFNTNASPSVPSVTLYVYNAGLINRWAVNNHLFNIAGNPTTQHQELESPYNLHLWQLFNTDSATKRLNYEFDSILTDGQMQAIKNQPFGSIGFNKVASDHLSKGIYELKWYVNTGKVEFKLFG